MEVLDIYLSYFSVLIPMLFTVIILFIYLLLSVLIIKVVLAFSYVYR